MSIRIQPYQPFSGSPLVKPQPATRFGSAMSILPAKTTGWAVPRASRLLKQFDFDEFANSTVSQIKVIYPIVIMSRILAGLERSKNEMGEHLRRDGLGYFSWLYGVPTVQALYLRKGIPHQYRKALVKHEVPTGAKKWLTLLNPFKQFGFQTVSAKAVESRWHQASQVLDRQAASLSPKALEVARKATDTHYKELLKYLRLSTGLGWVLTIAMLGWAINKINIAITRKNVAAGKVG